MTWLYVGLGGALGSIARYGIMAMVSKRVTSDFPYSTLTVNILGSLAMGMLVGILARFLPEQQSAMRAFIGVGFLGGFTTFSTFSLDMVTLIQRGEPVYATAYALTSVFFCIVGLLGGLYLMRLLPV